jgi:hypothetical protein
MQFDDLLDDGQAQPQPGCPSFGGSGFLSKPFEDVRQEIGGDPPTVVLNLHFESVARRPDVNLNPAALTREFDGVVNQVPQHLLQPS